MSVSTVWIPSVAREQLLPVMGVCGVSDHICAEGRVLLLGYKCVGGRLWRQSQPCCMNSFWVVGCVQRGAKVGNCHACRRPLLPVHPSERSGLHLCVGYMCTRELPGGLVRSTRNASVPFKCVCNVTAAIDPVFTRAKREGEREKRESASCTEPVSYMRADLSLFRKHQQQ